MQTSMLKRKADAIISQFLNIRQVCVRIRIPFFSLFVVLFCLEMNKHDTVVAISLVLFGD